jgi:ring-1,2-phenylacetyl-CoA epoxidase subunit PaaD
MVMSPNHATHPTVNSLDAVARVQQILAQVSDPEIPTLSVLEMGMISRVMAQDRSVVIDMTPTFAGCPALDMIRSNITDALRAAGFEFVTVNVVFDPPWTSDRITAEGREKLRVFGLAPPGEACADFDEQSIATVRCPFCDSAETSLESLFGPTLCRAIHYCNACQQSFEQFKPV